MCRYTILNGMCVDVWIYEHSVTRVLTQGIDITESDCWNSACIYELVLLHDEASSYSIRPLVVLLRPVVVHSKAFSDFSV